MTWNPADPLNVLALQLNDELNDVTAFRDMNGPSQRAFAHHVQSLAKPFDELTVADLKAAAAHASAELNDLQSRGLI